MGAFRNGYCSNPGATNQEICLLMGAEWNPEKVCVGSRKWDTSQCGSGICEIPVMGVDGYPESSGYMTAGAIPSFKIYEMV